MRIKIVGQYINLIRPFCVWYRWVFLRVVSYLDEPVGRVKIQTTRKNTPRYYKPKGLVIIDNFIIIQLAFFSAKSFGSFLIRREKQSRWRSVARAADWLNRYFLHYKITNCPNNRTISQDICTLFTRYLYSTLCSWIVKQRKEWFTPMCRISHWGLESRNLRKLLGKASNQINCKTIGSSENFGIIHPIRV